MPAITSLTNGALHPMTTLDQASETLAHQLLQDSPNSQLVDVVAQAGPLDWLCLCPSRRTSLTSLLEMARSRQCQRLVVDSADRAAAEAWLAAEGQGWVPRLVDLPDLTQRRGCLAHAFYGHPSRQMCLLAVTGTNGKSTVAHGLARCLAACKGPSASIGTLGVVIHRQVAGGGVQSQELVTAGLTSWPAVALAAQLASLRAQGVGHVVLEASSIGLESHRLTGCEIQVAALTNFSQDHLDYHGDLDSYARAKHLLFESPTLRGVVLAQPRPGALAQAHWLFQAAKASTQHLGQTLVDAPAGYSSLADQAPILQVGEAAIELPHSVNWMGPHNWQNLAVVAGCLKVLGLQPIEISQALAVFELPRGRLERVSPALDNSPAEPKPLVLVDYAHTPDALEQVLTGLQGLARQRGGHLRLVFGCGGDRDASKRAPMGRIAAELADEVWVTSDNPRSESPEAIAAGVMAGLPADAQSRVELDRAAAIGQAIASADSRDVVVIAGKGHERGQEIAGQRLPFEDQAVARAYLREWSASPSLASLVEGLQAAGLLVQAPPGLRPQGERPVLGFCTDSRQVQRGEVFIALSGDRFDGHTFCEAVAKAGAAALVVSRAIELPAGLAKTLVIQVSDTAQALTALAASWRRAWRGQVIGVVGSNGKTTVKEMMAHVLRAASGDAAVFATPGNLNNQIGVPLSLLRLRGNHQSAVIELGMNHPGEIWALAELAKPDLVIMTNAQREHQAHMKSVAACAEENGLALRALPSNSGVVLPMDAEHLPIWSRQWPSQPRLALFGRSLDQPAAKTCLESNLGLDRQSVTMVAVGDSEGSPERTGVQVQQRGQSQDLCLGLQGLGEHFATNAAAVLAASSLLGLPLDLAASALSSFQPMPGRGRIHRWPALQLVDDTYNANPDSVNAAIAALAEQPPPRAIVLGDMGEVGEASEAFHEEVLRHAAARGLERICLHGQAMTGAVQRSGLGEAFESIEALSEALSHWVDEQAQQGLCPTVWVKGSRFMRMERVTHAIQDWMTRHAARAH